MDMAQPLKSKLYVLAGLLSLVLGVIGIFLPLLPTTPFAILSAFLFQKGSPRLHRWLLSQPVLGPAIEDWDRRHVIRPRIKALACSLITLSLSYPIFFKDLAVWIKISASALGIILMTFILTRKSRD
jgi:hypothetical protein